MSERVERDGDRLHWVAEGGTRVVFTEHMHDSLPAQVAAASGYGGRRAQNDLARYEEIVEGG